MQNEGAEDYLNKARNVTATFRRVQPTLASRCYSDNFKFHFALPKLKG